MRRVWTTMRKATRVRTSATYSLLQKALIVACIFVSSFSQLNPSVFADDATPAVEQTVTAPAAEQTVVTPSEPTPTEQVAPTQDSTTVTTSSNTEQSTPVVSETPTTTESVSPESTPTSSSPEIQSSDNSQEINNTASSSEAPVAVEEKSTIESVNSGNQGAGGVADTGTIVGPVTGNKNILPPNSIWLQNGEIQIDDQASSALLKKDNEFQLKEIEMTERAVVTGSIGVTIIIPQDTKMFSPLLSGDVATGNAIDNFSVGSLASGIEQTGMIESVVTGSAAQPLLETILPAEDTPVENTQPVLPQDETTATGMTSEIISSSFEQEINLSGDQQTEQTVQEQPVLSQENIPAAQDPTMQLSDSGNMFAGQATLDSSSLVIDSYEETVKTKDKGWSSVKQFTFGLESQHLVFTKPVEIHVDIPNMKDGTMVLIRVKHTGDVEFNEQGLSDDATATCDTMGNISIPTGKAFVHSGQVVFYTCGASAFALGVPDINLDLGLNSTGEVYAIVQTPDSGFIIGGSFVSVGGIGRNGVARVSSTGLLDNVFGPELNGAPAGNPTVESLALQADGSVIIGGRFTQVGAAIRRNIARVSSTGVLDEEYDPSVTFINNNSSIYSIGLQTNGDAIVGGYFNTIGGTARSWLARITTTGLVDPTYDPDPDHIVNFVEIQSDDSALIGGYFSSVSGVTRNHIARVTVTGLVDSTFDANASAVSGQYVSAIEVQTDGKILIGGSFTGVGASARTNLARVSTTGLIDDTFSPDITGGGASQVLTIALQSDNKIIVGGQFTGAGGLLRNRVVRFTTTGIVDTTFDIDVNNTVRALAPETIQSSFMMGGSFTSVRGTARNGIARIGLVVSVCAGFDGCSLWLKAGSGVTSSATGLGVSGWVSQGSYDGISGVQANTLYQPTYVTGALGMNFNPVVRFSGGNHLLVANRYTYQYDNSTFAVFRTSLMSGNITTIVDTLSGNPTTCDGGFALTGGKVTSIVGNKRQTSTGFVNTNTAQLVSVLYGTGNPQVLFMSGVSNATGTTTGLKFNVPASGGFVIGSLTGTTCGITNGIFSGDIAEVISFNRRVSTGESQMINSYLALKYGISLDQTTGQDYVLSGGIVAWSWLSGGVYKNNIAGIGRNDITSLSQYQSMSANTTNSGDIMVQFTGSFSDNQTLTWANDGGSGLAIVAGDVNNTMSGYWRIARAWKFQERNGSIGNIYINYFTGATPVSMTGNTLYMFMNTGGDSLSGATTSVYTGTLVNGSWQFFVNPVDGAVISFGYSMSPLSVGLLLPTSNYALGFLDRSFTLTTNNVNVHLAYTNDATSDILAVSDSNFSNNPATVAPWEYTRTTSTGVQYPLYHTVVGAAAATNYLAVSQDSSSFVGVTNSALDGVTLRNVAHVTTTGLVDSGFILWSNVAAAAVIGADSSGGVYYSAAFTTISGANTSTAGIARTNLAHARSTGLIDLAFTPNPNGLVSAMTLQSDGKVMMGGFFTTFSGATATHIVRLTITGVIDPTFTTVVSGDTTITVSAITQVSDGSYFIGGTFTGVQGQVRNRIAHLSSTGLLDMTFTGDIGSGAGVKKIVVQSNGSVIAAGGFSGSWGLDRINLVRFTSTGWIDMTFDPNPINIGFPTTTLLLDSTVNALLIGGGFQTIAGISKGEIARIGLAPVTCLGIAGCSTWLRADQGVIASSSGLSVSGWVSYTTDASSGVQSSGLLWPSYVTGGAGMNFNPVVRFNSGSFLTMKSPVMFQYDQSVFTVFRSAFNSGVVAALTNTLDVTTASANCDRVLALSGGKITAQVSGQTITSTGLVNNNTAQLVSLVYGTGGFVDVLSVSGVANATGTNVRLKNNIMQNGGAGAMSGMMIGSAGTGCVTNRAFSGDIAEIITFNRRVLTGEAEMINSYLALKYGITISQTTGHNYVLSGGNIAWNWLSGGVYKNDIAGIARDDATTLSQYKSKSTNNSGDLLVEFTGTLDNLESLVWGSNGGHTGTLLAGDINNALSGYWRIGRAWKFQEKNGDIGNVTLSYYTGNIPVSMTGATVYLLMNTGSDSLSGTDTTVYSGSLVSGYWQFSVNPVDGALVTFAYLIPSGTGALVRSSYALGSIDPIFNPNAGNSVNSIIIQSDKNILIGGGFTTLGATSIGQVGRLTVTGFLYSTYNPNAGGLNVFRVIQSTDGATYAAGQFTVMGGKSYHNLARITSTGVVDSGFSTQNNANGIYAISPDGSGGVYFGGQMTLVSGANTAAAGVTRNNISHATSSGLIDLNFNPNADSTVRSLYTQTDGKIMMGGHFTTLSGTVRYHIARLTSTGQLDTSFNSSITGDAAVYVTSIAQAADGSYYVGGTFTGFVGNATKYFAHLSTTGLIDPNFITNITGTTVDAIVVQPDGDIVIGGTFTTIWGMTRNNLARVTSTGWLDMTFDPNPNGAVSALTLDTGSNSVLVGGAFTIIGRSQRNRIARIGLTPVTCLGIEGCSAWLRADQGVTASTTGLGVSGWASYTIDGTSGLQTSALFRPTYVTGVMNFNPVVRFSGGNYLQFTSAVMFQYDQSVFTVFRTAFNSGAISALVSPQTLIPTTCDRVLTLSGGKLTAQLSGETITSSFAVNTNTPKLASFIYGTGAFSGALSLSGVANVTGTAVRAKSTIAPNGGMLIGNVGASCVSGGTFSGDIAEIITFNRKVTIGETNMINSYLALKYGITIDQTTGHDYVLSYGTPVWSWLSGGIYNKDIAGIARDDATTLMQYTSQSTNYTGDIIVQTTGGLDNLESLIWANEGSATGVLATGYANNVLSGYERIARIWKFQEKSGDVGNVIVSLYSGTLPQIWTGGLVAYMFMNTGSNSLSGTDTAVYTGTLVSGNWQFTANPVDGALVSFGYLLPPSNTYSNLAISVVDANFNPNANNNVEALALQSDGAVIVGGAFTTMGGSTARNRIGRTTTTGLLDATFTGLIYGNIVNNIRVQTDGKILVAGDFTGVGAVNVTGIVRLTTTGIVDPTFSGLLNNAVTGLYLNADGSILIGGAFTTVGGTTRNHIARLSSTGLLDANFNPNADNSVLVITVQPDGKILIGGSFVTVGGTTRNHIARVTTTGLLDTTFDANVNGDVLDIEVQSDGKIIIGGNYGTVGGTARNNVARVTTTGLLDTAFNPSAIGSFVQTIALQPDDGMILGGNFTSMGGMTRGNIARVTSSGIVDTTFDANTNGTVTALALDSTNSFIMVGGQFNAVRNISRNSVARIGLVPSICVGLGGCSVWLNAGYGVTSSATGLGVSGWVSQGAYIDVSGVQSSTLFQPRYVTGAMNFNPVVRFSGGNYLMLGSPYFFQYDNSVFAVFRTAFNSGAIGALASTLVLNPTTCDRALVLSGGVLTSQLSGQTITAPLSVNNNIAQLASLTYGTGNGQNLSINAMSRAIGTATGLKAAIIPNSGMIIGNVGALCVANGPFSGDIAEIITFNRRVSTSEAQMINSYLALKYGITLDQTVTGQDYILSGGITAWSWLSGGIYKNNIAGIGRSDASSLSQLTGQSANDTGDIVVQLSVGNSLANNETLMWANNAVATGFSWTGNGMMRGLARVQRIWKFQEKNGDVGSLTISYASGNTVIATGGLYLITNTGGNTFTGTDMRIYTGVMTNNSWVFSGVTVVDGTLMTFGVYDLSTLAFSSGSMLAQQATGSLVGNIIVASQNTGSYTYTFDTTCTGTLDNSKFILSGNSVLTNYYFQSRAVTGVNLCLRATNPIDSTFQTGFFTVALTWPATSVSSPLSFVDSFNPNGNSIARSIATQPDGSYILVGDFTTIGAVARNGLARVTSTGQLDPTYTGRIVSTSLNVNKVILQPDGYAIVGGTFQSVNGLARQNLVRVTTTGQVDPTFTGDINGASVNAIALQSDGKILVGGNFTGVNGVTKAGFVRLTTTGMIDPTFTGNSSGAPTNIYPLSDGTIYIGGSFTTINGIARANFARLTSTGLVDLTFPNLTGMSIQLGNAGLYVQSDGNIIIAGSAGSLSMNGITRSMMIRVTSTGWLDSGFNANFVLGASAQVIAMTGLSDDSIIVGGIFTGAGGLARNALARYTSTGLIDMTFDPYTPTAIGGLFSFALSPDGSSLVVGGTFSFFGGLTRTNIARMGLLPSTCAGFAGCSAWLKADTGVTATSTGLTSYWKTQEAYGGVGVSGAQTTPALQPTYITGAMNGNPVIRFSSGNYLSYVSQYMYQYDQTEFVVFKTGNTSGALTSLGNTQVLGPTVGDRILYLSGGRVNAKLSGENLISPVVANTNTPKLVLRSSSTGTLQSFTLNGGNSTGGTIARRAQLLSNQISGMMIGNTNAISGGAYSGDIAEIITFNRYLSTTEKQMVSSYLALKYGLTLDQTTPTDYIFSGGVTAWNASSGGVYSGDIAGIGRNEVSSLNQFQSKSSNNSGEITVAFTGTEMFDNAFLTWGNNGAATGTFVAGEVNNILSGYQRIARIWKFQEKGADMGTVNISVYSGTIPQVWTGGGNLLMFVNTGGVSLTGSLTQIYTGTLVGGTWNFSQINIKDGSLMSFGFATIPARTFTGYALGVLDSMNPAPGPTNNLTVMADGSIVVVGGSMNIGGNIRNGVARFTSTGQLDSFDANIGGGVVNWAVVQSNQQIVVGGTFTSVGVSSASRLARLTSTGLNDPTFNVVVDNTITVMAIQPDGKILIGGSFTTVSGSSNATAVTRNRIARITSTGMVDSFDANLGGFPTAIAVQADGNILIGGPFFTTVGGVTRNHIARVTSTGQLDPTFNPDADGAINGIGIQSDGKIVIGGAFTTLSGGAVVRNRLARITSTGLIDTTYDPNVGNTIQYVTAMSDDRMVIGGAPFTTVGGMTRNNLARINIDGSLDTSFDPNVNSTVNMIAVDPLTPSIIIAGSFTTVGGVAKGSLARIGMLPSLCGGFDGCSTWLKAGSDVVGTSTGLNVSGWVSQGAYDGISGVNTTITARPDFVSGAMNFNPVVRFSSGDYLMLASQYFFQYDNSVFTVFNTPTNSSGTLTTLASTLTLNPAQCDRTMVLSGGKVTTTVSGQTITSTKKVNGNGAQLVSLTYGTGNGQVLSLSGIANATGTVTGLKASMFGLQGTSGMLIGNVGSNCVTNGAFSGDIAEIITFNRKLSRTESQMINSYLALKYGITLDQTVTGQDYILSGGYTAWSWLSAEVYSGDIAGIGYNSASTLAQYTSKSINNSGDIMVQFTGGFADNETLTWANDGGATGVLLTGAANNVPIGYNRIGRIWRFQEKNGDVGTVAIAYFSGSLPSGGTGTLYMIVNTGSDSLTDGSATTYTGSIINGRWQFSVNPVDGALVTFGYADSSYVGSLSIDAPTALAYTGTYVRSFVGQSATQYFANATANRFRVDDSIGNDSGYTTTLQLSGDLTTGSLSISAANVQFKVSSTGVDLVGGTANPRVVVDNGAINFQSLDVIRNFIVRDPAANGGVQGTYGTYLWLNIDVPSGQDGGAYAGQIVYTLIPN